LAFLQNVTIATRIRDVEARSEACRCVREAVWELRLAVVKLAYLTGLLLKSGKLLDCALKVGLRRDVSSQQLQVCFQPKVRTLARVSASGSCRSTSLEKSFSGLRAASDIVAACCVDSVEGRGFNRRISDLGFGRLLSVIENSWSKRRW
jgi:hypothetical protein